MISKKHRVVSLFGGGYSVQIKKWYGWRYMPGTPFFKTDVFLEQFLARTFTGKELCYPTFYESPSRSLRIKANDEIGKSYDKDDDFVDSIFYK